jgi:glucokinase
MEGDESAKVLRQYVVHNNCLYPLHPQEISILAYDYVLAREAMELMMKVYGGETGNVGLKYLPAGGKSQVSSVLSLVSLQFARYSFCSYNWYYPSGLYIAGGIAPHNMQYIKGSNSIFMDAFWNKGRVASILEDVSHAFNPFTDPTLQCACYRYPFVW